MYNIRTAGRFVSHKKYALDAIIAGIKEVGALNWLRIAFVLMWFTIYLIGYEQKAIEYAQAEEATSTVSHVEEKPALIELSYTKERVQELVREAFPDAPIMLKVAKCESQFMQHAYNPTNGSHDGGVYQISQKYHGKRMEELGLDPYDVKDNIAYARILYDEQGLAPWIWSKNCWSK